ncbi:HNH endonuclease domain-containing protein [Mangrovibacillus cuniculi]|uniref:HNH endonuclease n=1 Tax=Mangrovibacillus cuniculi TaxID=2593652 RepID=A0A7S8C8X9_9BACI|nr:HNH endonuclease domain-containing protein [Mangrovibacillus cuniculi]QPC45571.1 HNH endonuclease [Mangrovibacillus cuniculi]
MSHKLKVGELQEAYRTDEEIWRIFTIVLSTKSVKSSTYKFALMKALIENLYNVNEDCELTYNQLVYTFAKMYWNLVVKNNLLEHNSNKQKKAKVVTVIKAIQQRYFIPDDLMFDTLDDSIQLELTNKVKAVMKENVFGALYGDTNGVFYAFNHQVEVLRLHPTVHQFMMKYQRLIIYLTNYHMAKMIDSLNEVPDTNGLLNKIESIAKRTSLKPFEKLLLSYFDSCCFYCQKPLKMGIRETHVDHFIPWSFVQSDQIWNLVLSCNQCNLKKSDKLPFRAFVDVIMERNEVLRETGDSQVARWMENYRRDKVGLLYEYAVRNGFDGVWGPG